MYQEANRCGIRNSSILFLKKIAQTTLKKQLLSVVNFLVLRAILIFFKAPNPELNDTGPVIYVKT